MLEGKVVQLSEAVTSTHKKFENYETLRKELPECGPRGEKPHGLNCKFYYNLKQTREKSSLCQILCTV